MKTEEKTVIDALKKIEMKPAVKRELDMVIHKLRYPMKNILSKVPGVTLAGRAKRLKVSRQTMYVWMSEKFRPTRVQAKRIAKITGVPIENIIDNGFEDKARARAKARRKAARMAEGGGATPSSGRRTDGRGRGESDGADGTATA